MKQTFICATMLFTLCIGFSALGQTPDGTVDYVNPLVGSDSEFTLSNGNTYPAIALPWGMNFWTPVTNPDIKNGWAYQYDAYKIRGFKQTHQPSPWINDYGAFALMPMNGKLKLSPKDRGSWFSHKAEIVKPHYYRVYLADYDLTTEITPTERAAQFRITYPKAEESYLLLDAYGQGNYVKIIPEERKIIGYTKRNSGGVPANFKNYFVLYFDKDFTAAYTWKDGKLHEDKAENTGKHVMGVIKFDIPKKQAVHVRVASSFISHEQAELNLKRELGQDSFDQTREKAITAWNTELNRIEIEGGTVRQKRNFYTALYRTLLFPRKFYEFDKNNKMMHYSPYNGKVLPGYMFTDNGFWDTFRAVFPFFTLMYPEMNSHMMAGLANTYKESGWLPEWASPGHRNCMIGSNSASIIADSYLKGIRGYDINTLFEAIQKNSENEGPMHSVGRYGVTHYNKLGYIPYDVGVNENVARTLEYSFDDFTIWKLAQALNKDKKTIGTFKKRANFYRNVFDPSTNFMRGKNKDGRFQSPFVPEKWGDAFTEGCSWHYTWCVFHDPQGLIDLMGGKDNFIQKLDDVFTAPPTFDFSYYGQQIHEITEMLIANMGQYAHGNQPIQHAIYLYNYAGQPWKTQKWVRRVMDQLYTPEPDGLCGDEDNGQTSAWYVFSALGMYPVCPGTPEYVMGSPLFDKAILHLENGKTFTITAKDNGPENVYVKSAKFNRKNYTKTYLNHHAIMKGGKLSYVMSDTPNKKRGTKPADAPYSMSIDEK
jgi:predicted alpha-1,2-mannosidase